jgi:tripartite-type tricarboxylate transporter receptor subunit TctC
MKVQFILTQKKNDGHTILHINGSHSGYFNLPHFTKTFDDFSMVAKVERHLYAIAVRCDDPEIKSWSDLVKIEKASPGKLSMGSNKPGSLHHRQHILINNDQGIKMRFVPYKGTGGVVKDIAGGHLRVGFAQPGKWNKHIKSGVACPLALLNETRLDHPLWKDVPTIGELGAKYTIPHQFQGFMVKKGTSDKIMDAIAKATKDVINSDAYKKYINKQPHVIPMFEDDRKAITSNFQQSLKDAKVFMKANGII